MKSQYSELPLPGRSFEGAYLAMASLPALLLAGTLLFGWLRERAAQAWVESEATRLSAAGLAITDHQMTERFDEATSDRYTRQWKDVHTAVHGLEVRSGVLAFRTIKDFERVIPPDEQWNAEPFARAYAEAGAPIVEVIKELVEEEPPVWQPVRFHGFDTRLGGLQESRDAARLLATEFRVAVRSGDRAMAMQALEMMKGVADAYDWQIGWASQYVHDSHHRPRLSLLRQTLAFDFWTEEDLQRLSQELKEPDNMEVRWRSAIEFDQYTSVAEFQKGESMPWRSSRRDFNPFPFGIPSSGKAKYLRIAGEMSALRGAGSQAHIRKAERHDENRRGKEKTISVTGIPLADVDLMMHNVTYGPTASMLAKSERDRRWTLTAVAIKQFHDRENRWPGDLNELSKVSMTQSDIMATESSQFGYRIVGPTEAILWTAEGPRGGWTSEIRVLPDPPEPSVYTQDEYDSLVARIGAD